LNPVSSLSKNISPTIPLHSSPGVAHSQDGIHCESNSSGDIYLQPREDKRFDQGKLHIMADNCRKQELEKKNVNDKNISVISLNMNNSKNAAKKNAVSKDASKSSPFFIQHCGFF
jgi:hypothetical protein